MQSDDHDPAQCVGLPLDAFVLALKGYMRANRKARKQGVATVNWRVVRDLARTDAAVAATQDALLPRREE